jgi:hypothetical protein
LSLLRHGIITTIPAGIDQYMGMPKESKIAATKRAISSSATTVDFLLSYLHCDYRLMTSFLLLLFFSKKLAQMGAFTYVTEAFGVMSS